MWLKKLVDKRLSISKLPETIWTFPNKFLKKPLLRFKLCKKYSIKQSFLVKFKNKLILKTKNLYYIYIQYNYKQFIPEIFIGNKK